MISGLFPGGGEGGVGLFSAFVADIADLVTLVDSYPPAVTDAETNLDVCDNADLIEVTVEDVLTELEETYDATILDPPASGLSVDAVDELAELRIPPRLVCVSGDPATVRCPAPVSTRLSTRPGPVH